MLYQESLWIKERLEKINLPKAGQALNLGSSTLVFRTQDQPYIENNVIRPLKERGINVVHADKKKSRGVDIIVNVENITINKKYDLVLCTSMLEHVKNINSVAKKVIGLVKKGGYLLLSVPNVFPYHADPIDNDFRPSAKELASLFPSQRILITQVIKDRFPQSHVLKYKVALLLLQKLK